MMSMMSIYCEKLTFQPPLLHPRKLLTDLFHKGEKKKLRGLSPQANYTDRAAAAGRQS